MKFRAWGWLPLLLMLSATESLMPWQWLYVIVMGLGSLIGVDLWCTRQLQRNLGLTEES